MSEPKAKSKTFSFFPADFAILKSLRNRMKPEAPRKGKLRDTEVIRKALRALAEKEGIGV